MIEVIVEVRKDGVIIGSDIRSLRDLDDNVTPAIAMTHAIREAKRSET